MSDLVGNAEDWFSHDAAHKKLEAQNFGFSKSRYSIAQKAINRDAD